MKSANKKSHLLHVLVSLTMGASLVQASGYEKGILWGGKYSGVAGVGSPGVKGSDSLFYNPAGLVKSSEFGEFVFNLSQSSSQAKGPIVPNTSLLVAGTPPSAAVFTHAENQASADSSSVLIPGITYSMKLSDNFSFGLGYYAVGGTRAVYENIDMAPRSFQAKVGSEISITEFAAGLGYKVSDSFRLGASVRYTMTTAEFSSLSYVPSASGPTGAIANIELKDIKSNQLDSLRLGAQYDLNEMFKLGLMIRTETKLKAKGKASGSLNTLVNTSGSTYVERTLPVSEVDADVETYLPMAIGLGTEITFSEAWKMYAEYVFTQYSRIDKVVVDGNITLGTTTTEISDIEQKWKDQHQVKLAGEYSGISWPIRFGYIWTSQVSNADYARASFTPPGAAATYTLGTGQEFKAGDQPLELNLALDYTTVSGNSSDTPASATTSPKGKYEISALGIHTGVSYRF
ncbi:MAG: outer membrane protein transport protein [Bdellovibrionaceae bacterium]|nr:outer membrane protein transport protein [Pseudobdellovibrionaceae bacterium]NUM56976.1 outer membrane protein transport protein [Pseudobdellovibrionaceae bacterium]